jgi:hypothetical protein
MDKKYRIAALFLAGTAIAKSNSNFQDLAGIPVDISEARFLQEYPDAHLLRPTSPSEVGDFYLYIPKDLKWSNYRIATVGRGFESGQGCAVLIGLSPLSEKESSDVVRSLQQDFTDSFESRKDSVENEWFFLESSEYYISAIISKADSPGGLRPMSVSVSSKNCDDALAMTRWQTRPRSK